MQKSSLGIPLEENLNLYKDETDSSIYQAGLKSPSWF